MKKELLKAVFFSVFVIFGFLSDSLAENKDSAETKKVKKIKIPSKADTVVLASNKSAKAFYIELKRRAVMNNYSFESTDDDSFLFVTNFFDLSKRTSVQFKVYVKDVGGGSNAVYSGQYLDLKKVKRYPWYRPKPIYYRAKGKAAKEAWDAFVRFSVGAKKWKYTFIKR